MNLPERFPPDDPREWLNRARSNLALAKNRIPDAYLEDLCFEAQQAAEKAIKAVLIASGIEFPYVHDLARLLSLLEESGIAVPNVVRKGRGTYSVRNDRAIPRTNQASFTRRPRYSGGALRSCSPMG